MGLGNGKLGEKGGQSWRMEEGIKHPTPNNERPTSIGGSGWWNLRIGLVRRRRDGAGWRSRVLFPDSAGGFGGGHGEHGGHESPEDAGEGAGPIETENVGVEDQGGGGLDDAATNGFGLMIIHRDFLELVIFRQGLVESDWLAPAQPYRTSRENQPR